MRRYDTYHRATDYEEDWVDVRCLDVRRHRAKTEQGPCSRCRKPILPGEVYWRQFYLYDGSPSTLKHHSDCAEPDVWHVESDTDPF